MRLASRVQSNPRIACIRVNAPTVVVVRMWWQVISTFAGQCLKAGGANRDRTDDPLLAKQVLSQLSYGP